MDQPIDRSLTYKLLETICRPALMSVNEFLTLGNFTRSRRSTRNTIVLEEKVESSWYQLRDWQTFDQLENLV